MDSNYVGLKVAACAKTYYDSRRTDEDNGASKVIWNYNTAGIFDSGFRLRGLPEFSAVAQKEKRNGNVKGNLIDCSTFAGLVLRGIDYENSPYALLTGDTWNPSDEHRGIRVLTERFGGQWKQTALDSQPAGFRDIGYSGCSTIRSAADLGAFFSKNSEIIYDSERDGKLKKITDGDKCIGFSADDGENVLNRILPGDLLFWSKYGWHAEGKNVALENFGISIKNGKAADGDAFSVTVKGEAVTCNVRAADKTLSFNVDGAVFKKMFPNDGEYVFSYGFKQKDRFRAISHIAIAAEDVQYYYEATSLKYTLYRRSLFPTELTPKGTFGDICLIIRPKY